MNNLLKNTVTIYNKVWPRPSGNRKLTSIAAYSAHLKYSSQKCIMNIPSRQLVMKYLIHVLFNDQLIIIMVYIFHTKNHMYMISFIQIMWHSVKSSWELVLIVIQKPNSNKVFLLVHLDQRSMWTIAITWRPSSVVCCLSSVVCCLSSVVCRL